MVTKAFNKSSFHFVWNYLLCFYLFAHKHKFELFHKLQKHWSFNSLSNFGFWNQFGEESKHLNRFIGKLIYKILVILILTYV